MHKVRLILFLVLTLGVLALTRPSNVALAANFTVTNCDNDSQLRDYLGQVQSVSEGGSISFNCGTKTIVLTGGVLPPITKSTYIDGGNKITLSGNNATRHFIVYVGGSLNLYNMTLTKGSGAGDGGSIINSGTVSTSVVNFTDNIASASGGAIVSYGGLYIVGGQFSGNKAVNGGAIYPRHSAVTTINSARIHDNQATGTGDGFGGAMLLWDGAKVTITNSTVDHNKARVGGGVYVTNNSSLTVESSTFNDNEATQAGGAIYNAFTLVVRDSTLSKNKGGNSGGGIDNYLNGVFTLINTTLSANSANFGGGVNNTKGNGTMTNVTIVGNTAVYNGGGIDNGTYTGSGIAVKNVLLANNTGGNCYDTNALSINSQGYNLSSDNTCTQFFDQAGDQNIVASPGIGPLAKNGGPTQTHLLLANSPAINTGSGSGAPALDQRGIPRPQGAANDIGAVEVCAKPQKPMLQKPVEGKKVKPKAALDWSDAVCATTYKVQVKLGDKNGPNAFVSNGLTTSAVKTTPLASGQTYYWRVTAMGPGGKAKSPWQSFKIK